MALSLADKMLQRANPDGGYETFCFREAHFGQVARRLSAYDETYPNADVLPPEIDGHGFL